MKDLIKKLNQATKAYDEGLPIMSDAQWDELYFQLEQKEKETGIVLAGSPTHHIDYQVMTSLEKVEHNHPMLSLAKTKDWLEFIQYFESDKDVALMLKLDGLTCSLRYLDGELVGAETRGNGEIGENILHNARVITSIPQHIPYKDELVVDGEIICTYQDFAAYSDNYANPRNFASGSIRLLDASECAKRSLSFVAWRVVKGLDNINSFISRLEKLDDFGFDIVPYTAGYDLDAPDYLKEFAKRLGYPIDGLVGRYDDIRFGDSLGATAHHEKSAFAFKFYDEHYPTKLLDIEWSMGRNTITPVAIVEPVETDNAVVNKASLHNLSIMTQLLGPTPYVGQYVELYMANDVIPQIENTRKSGNPENILRIPDVCPACGAATYIEGDNLYCSNHSCPGRLVNSLDHFCCKKYGLDIQGLSTATIQKLIDLGWLTCKLDIFSLWKYADKWKKEPGFGPASVAKILASIEAAKTTTLEHFISSLGIPFIGITVAKELTTHIKSYDELREKIESRFDFSEYAGFAESKSNALLSYDYSEADKIYELLNIVKENNKEDATLNGVVVCITGKLTKTKNRDDLVSKIQAHGGKVASSVSKNTNYLINNDATSQSSKNQSAAKLGIPILTENDFYEKFFDK